MKALNYRVCYLLLFILSSWLSGCINIEREKHPVDWPQLISITDLKDLEGLYENDGSSTGGDDLDRPMSELWYFLTRKKVSCGKDAVVKITVVETASVKVELIESKNRLLEKINLKNATDFTMENGLIILPSEGGAESGGLGVGVGAMNCRLHKSEDGGLTGEMTGAATGLALYVIPTIGFGKDWNYWKKINQAQQ